VDAVNPTCYTAIKGYVVIRQDLIGNEPAARILKRYVLDSYIWDTILYI